MKKRKKYLISLIRQVYTKMIFFSWLTKQHGTHDVEVTNNTRAIRWSDGDKKKIYLRIILLINYMIEENLFVNVE